MGIIKTILKQENIGFTETGENQYDIDDVGGNISEESSFSYFLHGNRTIRIPNGNKHLKDLVKAYTTGFDEFADTLKRYL